MALATVNNGVNVQALLDAREALKGAPEAAKFTWRASCKWQNGTHSKSSVNGFFGLGQEQQHKTETSFEADHPEIFASEDKGITPIEYVLVGLASCLTAGVAAVAQNRGIQLQVGRVEARRQDGYPRHPRHRQRRAQRLRRHQGDLQDRRGRVEEGHRSAGRAVAEALGGLRRDHQPGERHGRSGLTSGSGAAAIERVTTVVIGAGHAGLAVSRCLTERSIDHVVVERGEVANSWRRERWESLRLLTPNWQSRLPGFRYDGPDPDGYMTMGEVIAFISRFAAVSRAPVRTQTAVTSVKRTDRGYRVATSGGEIESRSVVLATGACNVPTVPSCRDSAPSAVEQITPFEYRNPASLPDGGVLVVGASATGVQLADEIHRSGRRVVLSVGEHVRLPRTYRGRDVLWWMDAAGVWNQRYDEIDDLTRARRLPSPQLVGTPARTTLDLNALTAAGVELAGRLSTIRDGTALFSGALRNHCALADLKMERLLDTFDEWARAHPDGDVGAPERFQPTRVPSQSRLRLDLRSGEIRTIVWATGFRPDYRWLDVPVLDEKGQLRHDGGVVDAPGLYVIGLPVLRRRKSSFIQGAEDDARELTAHLAGFLSSEV